MPGDGSADTSWRFSAAALRAEYTTLLRLLVAADPIRHERRVLDDLLTYCRRFGLPSPYAPGTAAYARAELARVQALPPSPP